MPTGTLLPPRPRSPFISELQTALASQLIPEMEITLRVGVMSAGGLTRAEILAGLRAQGIDADELDVRMSIRRLQRIYGPARQPQQEATP